MKYALLLTAIATSLISTGCARYQPAQEISQSILLSEEGVRSKIIAGANRSKWNVCQKDESTLQISRIYKNYNIYIDALYKANSYQLTVDTELTNLVDENGNVHKAVNKLLQKLDRHIAIAIPERNGQTIEYDLPKCSNVTATGSTRGSIFTRWKGTSELSWEKEKITPLPTPKFSYSVTAEDTVPAVLAESLHERVGTSLLNQNLLLESGTPDYAVRVHLLNFYQHSNGGASDAIWGTGNEKLELIAMVYDRNNRKVATIKANAYVPTGSVFGGINKASKRITAVLNQGLMQQILENFTEQSTK